MRLDKILVTLLICCVGWRCTKLVDVDPPQTSLSSDNVFTNDATAASVLTGLYADLSKSELVLAQNLNSLSLIGGLAADELSLYGGAGNGNKLLVQYYQNRLLPGSSDFPTSLWSRIYANIYILNLTLERLEKPASLTPVVKMQLTGEARFLRAFNYFYLVNMYGPVPLVLSSDYQENLTIVRSSPQQVYKQIETDLSAAVTLLGEDYRTANINASTTARLRPNLYTARALLARVYLYQQKWNEAIAQSTIVIDQKHLYDTVPVSGVFLGTSREAIWQLQPVNTGWNTEDARAFILPAGGPTGSTSSGANPVFISQDLLNAFEPLDSRKIQWINKVTTNGGAATYYYPYKYKSASLNAPSTENLVVLRLAEQYLIRAEARASINNITGAQQDLNLIRKRAGLPPTNATTQAALIDAILKERQKEFFTEWGHRWFDLKRTGKINDVMVSVAPAKGSTWQSDFQLWPIPLYDIIQNPNLTQNSGY